MFQGKLIKYHRTRKEMTQKELAAGICSVSYLSKIENETIEPSQDVLSLLGERLHITLDIQEDSQDVEKRILEWYNHIKDNDYKRAQSEYKNLQKIYQGTNNHVIKYLFLTIEFGYLLAFEKDNKIITSHYRQLREMQELFNPLTYYYFHKLESIYFYNKNDLVSALESLKEAEKVYPSIDLIDLSLYYNLAVYYSRADQLYKSLHNAFKALHEAQMNYDLTTITKTFILISTLYIRIGEYGFAENELLKLKKEELNITPQYKSLIYHNLGYIYYQQKKYEKAIQHLRDSLEQSESEEEQAETIYVLSLVYYTILDLDQFEETVKFGLDLAEKINSRRYLYKFYIIEAKKNQQIYDTQFIEKLQKEIIPYFKESGDQYELLRLYKLIGDIHFHNRQYKKAGEYYQLTHQFYSNTFRVEDYL
ncbi:Tetratricopeptide repeat-containing protein [Salinibacillus kushneri]|uniref:Tetratricopeptide repeat-containing protein n=1 Tax=Salinibacillus kushneri TaxID=237682 RepID=A0A1I0BDP7_9BACI|nr:helix-turn-helix domain-containing protein [Salinibacillus kushneri]SET04628.1 Tetratricopeptide repeat-containing protein [Salinibacillus kushneri]